MWATVHDTFLRNRAEQKWWCVICKVRSKAIAAPIPPLLLCVCVCVCVCARARVCISASPSGIACSGELDCHVDTQEPCDEAILGKKLRPPGGDWHQPSPTWGSHLESSAPTCNKSSYVAVLADILWPPHVRTTQLTHSQLLDHRNCEDNHCLLLF